MGDHAASVHSSKYFFCIGAALLVLGSILLCVFGFIVVYPHHVTLGWTSARCRVINVTYYRDLCSCGQPSFDDFEGCFAKYPCLRIFVQYNTSRNDTEERGLLYRHWGDAFYQDCTLYECGDEHWNLKTIHGFENTYGVVNKTFSCHFDPIKINSVVLTRTPMSSVIHAVLWPSLLLLGGSVVLLGMCLGCWRFEEEEDVRDAMIKK